MAGGIPEGFVPYSQPSPFLDRIGPVYERRSGDSVTFGLIVLDHHCNRRGIAHGGLLVTLADVALGKTAEWLNRPPARLITTSIAYDFVGSTKLGDWIEAQSDFYKVGREVAFANCYFRVNGRVIGRANGQFKVASEA
ncbi:MAG: esterase [Rhodospirillales bacterium]|nr:esterase [Rhodospirillales bacterium]